MAVCSNERTNHWHWFRACANNMTLPVTNGIPQYRPFHKMYMYGFATDIINLRILGCYSAVIRLPPKTGKSLKIAVSTIRNLQQVCIHEFNLFRMRSSLWWKSIRNISWFYLNLANYSALWRESTWFEIGLWKLQGRGEGAIAPTARISYFRRKRNIKWWWREGGRIIPETTVIPFPSVYIYE